MNNETKVKKGDFVEIHYTGKANGNVFDSNISEDLKSLDSKAEPKKTIVVIGENMLVPGLDREIEGKEPGKEYSCVISAKEGFGPRRRELVKTIPLSVFTKQKINPRPGASLLMDNQLVRIITVSGARVIADFNNPLSGKDLEYKFIIDRIVDSDSEKAETLFDFFFSTIPEFSIKEILVKLPKEAEPLISLFSEKFEKLMGKSLKLEIPQDSSKPENGNKTEDKSNPL